MPPEQLAKNIYDLLCVYAKHDLKLLGNPNNALKALKFEVVSKKELEKIPHDFCLYMELLDHVYADLIPLILQWRYGLDKIRFSRNSKTPKEGKQNSLYLKVFTY